MVFSDDLTHDYHFVFVIQNIRDIVIHELQQMGCHFTAIHCRSDGCGVQYKNCNFFGDLSRAKRDLGVPIIWNYSAAGHGKGEVDSAAGVIKTAARRAVIAEVDNVVIQSAQDFLQFCKDHFKFETQQASSEIHGRRFFEVQTDQISRTSRGNYTTV